MPPADACAFKHAYGLWDDDHRRAIYTRGFAWEVQDVNPFARHLELYARRDTADQLDCALYVDARTFLPDNTLAIAERAALAAGLHLSFRSDRQLGIRATVLHRPSSRTSASSIRELLRGGFLRAAPPRSGGPSASLAAPR